MASKIDLSQELQTTPEKTNHARLCRLLVEGGTKALRCVFNSCLPQKDLVSHLNKPQTRQDLMKLKTRKVINAGQWNTLYPTTQGNTVNSDDFDITLLMILLRNICNMTQPKTGWDKQPQTGDHSIEADIVRIKCYRNMLCHSHRASTSYDDFERVWDDIASALERLGATEADIGRLKTESMDSELEQQFNNAIETWIKADEEVNKKVNEIDKKVDQILESLQGAKSNPTDGELSTVAEYDKGTLPNTCSTHIDSQVDLYCRKCNQVICRKCTVLNHKDHEFVNIADANAEISKATEMFHDEKKKLTDEIEIGKEYTLLLKTNYDAQVESIRKCTQQNIDVLRKQEEDMLKQLTSKYEQLKMEMGEELKTLTHQEEWLNKNIEELQDAISKSEATSLTEKHTRAVVGEYVPLRFTKLYDTPPVFVPTSEDEVIHIGRLFDKTLPSDFSLDVSSHSRPVKQGDILSIKVKSKEFKGHSTIYGDKLLLTVKTQGTPHTENKTYVIGHIGPWNTSYCDNVLCHTIGSRKVAVTLRDHHIQNSPITVNVLPWTVSDSDLDSDLDGDVIRGLTVDTSGNIIIVTNTKICIIDSDGHKHKEIPLSNMKSSYQVRGIAITNDSRYFVAVDNSKDAKPSKRCSFIAEVNSKGETVNTFGQTALQLVTGIAVSGKRIYAGDESKRKLKGFSITRGYVGKKRESIKPPWHCPDARILISANITKEKYLYVDAGIVSGRKEIKMSPCGSCIYENYEKEFAYICEKDTDTIYNLKFHNDRIVGTIPLGPLGLQKPDLIAVTADRKLVITVDDNTKLKILS